MIDADKKNRRRVKLENLILLLLRCLAVFLIGLLLARPFLSNAFTGGVLNAAQFEFVLKDMFKRMTLANDIDAKYSIAAPTIAVEPGDQP